MTYVQEVNKLDEKVSQHGKHSADTRHGWIAMCMTGWFSFGSGVTVFVDPKALFYMLGTYVDALFKPQILNIWMACVSFLLLL